MRHEESSLQIACVRWFDTQFPQYTKLLPVQVGAKIKLHRISILIAIPNHAVLSGTPLQRARQWKRLEAEGAVTGAADLFLIMPKLAVDTNYYPCGCFFELKTSKGKQSPQQVEFQKQVEAQGYEYVIIRDLDSFIKKVKEYL